jgi:hypothetical protein
MFPPYAIAIALASAFAGCSSERTLAEQCGSAYPRPTDEQLAAHPTALPPFASLPIYQVNDSLPQIFTADSSIARFRNLYYARFGAFRSEDEIRSFIHRFDARVVGRADSDGWYAILIPDPGPDTATFNLLLHCIGATHGVYVRSVSPRPQPLLRRPTANDSQRP